MKKIFKIKGMHCNSCAQLIEIKLKDKVNNISVNYANEKAEIDFDENRISEDEIIEKINTLGYEVIDEYPSEPEITEENEDEKIQQMEEQLNKLKQEREEQLLKRERAEKKKKEPKEELVNNKVELVDKIGFYVMIASIILLIAVLYFFVFKNLPGFKIPQLGEKTSLILLFAAGLLTGFHCISMCGSFVLSYTTKNAMNGHKSFSQHLVYGSSKIISYTIIGGIFGLIGGIFAFSAGLRGWVAILAGIFMIFYALSMFGIGFFKKFQFNPKFLTKIASNTSQSAKGPYITPLVTGLLNGLFIACGPLQAMYLYAAGTGSFISGAASLFVFGLGTVPVMLGFGSLATVISNKTSAKILKVSAVIVLILGLIMLNRGLTLTGSDFNYDSLKSNIAEDSSNSVANNVVINNGIQKVNMNVDARGYSPNSFVIKKGVPVEWNINVELLTGCNQELVLNDYNIDINLKEGLNVVKFTPTKTETSVFSCGMGMLRGSFIVTETGQASQEQIKKATPAKGMQCGGSSGGGCGCGG